MQDIMAHQLTLCKLELIAACNFHGGNSQRGILFILQHSKCTMHTNSSK